MADAQQAALERVARDPRRQWGWGPSELAGGEERAAYEAYTMLPMVESGQLPVSAFPEEYGGRPRGTTRRALRMQSEWDKAQERRLQNERTMQYMDEVERQQNVAMLSAARDAKVKEQSKRFMEAVIGSTLPDGTRTEPIDIYDDDAVERIQRQMYMNDFGMEDPYARDVANTLLKDAIRARASKLAEAEQQKEEQQKQIQERRSWLVGQQEEASALNVDTSKFITADPESGEITNVDQLGLSKAIGEAKRKDLESKKKEIAQAKLDEETKDQARSILDEINKTDAEIRKANFSAGREKNATKRDEFIANAEFYRSERDVLVERFNSLMPQKPAEEAAQPQQTELSPRDQSALDWANANPDDPRSQRIKQRLGVE